MTSVENESSEIPELLEISEQGLRLENVYKPYYCKKGDLYVIIAREINFRNGKNYGNLRAGIIRLTEDNDIELILPFSRNLIYADIKDDMVELAYVENRKLNTKSIFFNQEGKLNIEDFAFLYDSEDLNVLSTSSVSR